MALPRFSADRIDAAQAAAHAILRLTPEDPGALHLLGIIAHGSGRPAEAEALLRRAAESTHATASHLLSYAELCLKASDPAAAIATVRQALALDGRLPLAWLSLGGMLLDTRQFEQSRAAYERAVDLDPTFWHARCGLACALMRLGDAEASLALSEQLLHEQPGNAEAQDCLAKLLQEMGRYEQALAVARMAASQRPDQVEFQLRAADIELDLGRLQAALARLEAVEGIARGDVKLLTLKAHLLRLLDRFDEAVELCRDAIHRGAESGELLRAYGLALHLAGRETDALHALDRAAAMRCGNALSDKGVVLTQLGRLAEACAAFEQALSQEPTLADAWYNKSSAKPHAPGDPDIDAMERLLGGYCSARDRLLLHFALGKAHMDTGATQAAFFHWHTGNGLKRAAVDYDAEATTRRMAAIAEQHVTCEVPKRLTGNRRSELPVFIVGMPRSGSSLVEQMLASHPEVHGAGELLQLRGLFESADPVCGADSTLAEAVLQRLHRASTGALRIVDKDLANFLHLGLIHRLFPNARIIHCRRNPLDSCLSAYTKLFVGNLGFTYRLDELGRYYRDYHGLMAHWRSRLSGKVFIDVDYEALVEQPEHGVRRLLDFLGLTWNDACLRFFETERTVSTSSFAQVRRPIYRSSIGRAAPLHVHLQPLIHALGDLAPNLTHASPPAYSSPLWHA